MSSVFKPSLAVALVLGFATTAYAATGEFGNMCSWGLANHKNVQTGLHHQFGVQRQDLLLW